jgi:hypothetical protein
MSTAQFAAVAKLYDGMPSERTTSRRAIRDLKVSLPHRKVGSV